VKERRARAANTLLNETAACLRKRIGRAVSAGYLDDTQTVPPA
jgi:hypothetical protein